MLTPFVPAFIALPLDILLIVNRYVYEMTRKDLERMISKQKRVVVHQPRLFFSNDYALLETNEPNNGEPNAKTYITRTYVKWFKEYGDENFHLRFIEYVIQSFNNKLLEKHLVLIGDFYMKIPIYLDESLVNKYDLIYYHV